MNERVHFPQLYNLTTAIRGQELKAYSFPLMRVADKFHKLNRQTPARRPAYMLREHITGKLLETLRKKCAKKNQPKTENLITISTRSDKAASAGRQRTAETLMMKWIFIPKLDTASARSTERE